MSADVMFRIIAFPETENDRRKFESFVKTALTESGLRIESLTVSRELDSKEDDRQGISDTSKILQKILLFFEVCGTFTSFQPISVTSQFQKLCNNWLTISSKLFLPTKVPWLVVTNKNAFIQTWENHHVINSCQVLLGSHTSSSLFCSHKEVEADVTFFHDMKVLKVKYSKFMDPKIKKFTYDKLINARLKHSQSASKRHGVEYAGLYEDYDYDYDHDYEDTDYGYQDFFDDLSSDLEFDHIGGYKRPSTNKTMLLYYSYIRHVLVCSRGILIVFSCPPTVKNEEENERVESSPIEENLLGKSNSIFFHLPDVNKVQTILSRLHYRCSKIPISFVPLQIISKEVSNNPSAILLSSSIWLHHLNFNCKYLVEALFRRTFVLELQDLESFLNAAYSLSVNDSKALEKSLTDLLLLMDQVYPINMKETVKVIFENITADHTQSAVLLFVPPKTKLIRRAVLTPTRVLLYPPEIIIENRVLRHFNSDYALRVSFRDDDFFKLNIKLPLDSGIVSSTITKPMLAGLSIGGRDFQFLAWSNSQIRDHSVWLYARDDQGNTAASIRKWMGDFSNIKQVPKFMARMGQCFSQTADAIRVPVFSQRVEADIERGFDRETIKPYCFSDGIGRISSSAVERICKSQDIIKPPSAFQIRYGGCKGMLVTDPVLLDKDVVFRKSMVKFSCNQDRLEIVKHSSATPVSLNRPMIAILDHLRVPSQVLLRMQEDTLRTLTEMLLDNNKAAIYLAYHNNLRKVDFEDARDCGVDFSSEPFFRSMLLARHEYDITGIRKKARLPIDPSEGRNMFGVLDETRSLQYGQVFVQYTTNILGQETNTQKTILRGKVLVTKNPCYLAGDIRILDCVDVPTLHHIVDCIVFPQLGHRPHPNEMSGSDLDGDEYTVIWKKDLLFRTNAEPGHFPAPQAAILHRPITVTDMVSFLKDFIQNDRIGFIASTHLAVSDELRVNDPKALEIARFCSIAVDFPKTGVQVNLSPKDRPLKYPDFMERDYKESYKSKKALGKLFRVCRDFQKSSATVGMGYANVQVDNDFEYPGWQKYKTEAQDSLSKYAHLLEQLLSTYGVKHESEAMTGAFSSIHSRFQECKDRYETEELVAIFIRALWKKTYEEFFEEFLPCTEIPVESIFRKASAWYMVTYSQTHPTVLSFPWIMTKYLAQIKQLNLAKRGLIGQPSLSPLLTRMNVDLEQSINQLPNLNPNVIELIRNSRLNAFRPKNVDTLISAARVLINWAKEMELVWSPNKRGPKKGFMEEISLITLLLFVDKNDPEDFGVLPSILNFFKFCISLRFLTPTQKNEILPFRVPQDSFLSKQAMLSYRNLAVQGSLSALFIGEVWDANEVVEMEPVRIQKATISVQHSNFRNLLIRWSGVMDVQISDWTKWQYVINARGKPFSVQTLDSILHKGDPFLREAILRGELPKK